MARGRPKTGRMTPELQAQLAKAEAEVQKINSAKGTMEEKTKEVYSSGTGFGGSGFNVMEEMQLMQNEGIINNQNMEGINMPKTSTQMEYDALKTAGFTEEAKKMEGSVTEKSNDEKKQDKLFTADEKLQALAIELEARFGQDAPKLEILKQWHNMYRNIFILPLDDKDIFVYRYLNRQEWKQINEDPAWNNMPPLKQEEYIVNKCLLFPRYDITGTGRLQAGAYTTLAEAIKLQSLFLPPVYVAEITIKI